MPIVMDRRIAERNAAEMEEAARNGDLITEETVAAEQRETEALEAAIKAAAAAKKEADSKRATIYVPLRLLHVPKDKDDPQKIRTWEPRRVYRLLAWMRTQTATAGRIKRLAIWTLTQAERVYSYAGVRVYGKADAATVAARRAKCDECGARQEYWRLDRTYFERCGPCGCPLPRKLALAHSECPLRRWDEPRRSAAMEAAIVEHGGATKKELDLAIAGCGSCGVKH